MKEVDIKFREMTDDEFERFSRWDIIDYSKDLVKSGNSSEENALKDAEESFYELLPEGKNTKDNYICVIQNNSNEDAGFIWYQKFNGNMAFICDFLVIEKYRRRGYGRAALLLVEKDAKKKGLNQILLNVFRYNKPAFALYKSVGYGIRDEENQNISMIKDI